MLSPLGYRYHDTNQRDQTITANENIDHTEDLLAEKADLSEANVFTSPQIIRTASDSIGNEAGVQAERSRGSLGSPTAVLDGDRVSLFTGTGHDGSGFPATKNVAIAGIATEDHSPGNHGTKLQFEVTANGAGTRVIGGELTADGWGGFFILKSAADGSGVPVGAVYYSTTQSAVVYKTGASSYIILGT